MHFAGVCSCRKSMFCMHLERDTRSKVLIHLWVVFLMTLCLLVRIHTSPAPDRIIRTLAFFVMLCRRASLDKRNNAARLVDNVNVYSVLRDTVFSTGCVSFVEKRGSGTRSINLVEYELEKKSLLPSSSWPSSPIMQRRTNPNDRVSTASRFRLGLILIDWMNSRWQWP